LSGKHSEAGRWVRETHDYLSLPLLARANAVIPVGANEQQPDYDYADGVRYAC
jgi:alpha-D-xyloside xylohydrolase